MTDKELEQRFCKWMNIELKLEFEDLLKLEHSHKITEEQMQWKELVEAELKRRKIDG